MKEEQLPKLNSDLSGIEKKVKSIQDKYSNPELTELDQEDIEYLLSILDKMDEQISNLDNEETTEDNNETENE